MKRHLRIGIDIHSIGSQGGGNETYYRELVSELLTLNCLHTLFCYHTSDVAIKHFHGVANCALKRLVPGNRMLRIPLTIPWRSRTDALDLFHAQFIVPPFLKCKTVTTIPDIAFEHYPHFFPVFQRAALRLLVRESALRADHIITVSQHSKKDIIETYDVLPEKITVTYEGAGTQFKPIDKPKAKQQILGKYGIEQAFILYVGRLQARKNLRRLVDAYGMARKAGVSHKLVLAGKHDSLFAGVLSRIHELKLKDHIMLLGYVDNEDLPALYNAADIFVYPSLYEGFGLPVMEAMACGTPVITSRGCCLAEIAGEAALLIDPLDESSIADAITSLIASPERRHQLSRAGLLRSGRFSFREAARQTMDIYQRVTGMDAHVTQVWPHCSEALGSKDFS